MKQENNTIHPTVLFIRKKLKKYGRRDYCFNFEPLRNIRVEIHRVVIRPFLFVRVARKTVNKITESLVIEDWIPIEEYRFFLEDDGRIKRGTIFLDEGNDWKKYSPSEVAKSRKLEKKLKDLKKLIKKANRLTTYN